MDNSQELTHFFVCSPNQPLILAYHDRFKVKAPSFGGSAARYRAGDEQVRPRLTDPAAQSLGFGGNRILGAQVEGVRTAAEALEGIHSAGAWGAFVAYVCVNQAGLAWVMSVHGDILELVRARKMPLHPLFSTTSRQAAEYLLESFNKLSR